MNGRGDHARRGTRALAGAAVVLLWACEGVVTRAPPVAPSTPATHETPATPVTPATPDAPDGDAEGDELPVPAPPLPGAPRTRTFDDAKRLLVRLYEEAGRTTTLYCGCAYRGHAVDTSSCGYVVQADAARAARLEWEHVVPASAFGRTFREWREGHPSCMKKGRAYRGRKCAHHASPEFAHIEGDMHNLFPEDGEINSLRGDRMMGMIPGEARAFGTCDVEITATLFEPRPEIRGEIARAYKYMEATYPGRGIVPDGLRPMLDAWDASDPPDAWERARNEKIAALQGNRNPFIDEAASRAR